MTIEPFKVQGNDIYTLDQEEANPGIALRRQGSFSFEGREGSTPGTEL